MGPTDLAFALVGIGGFLVFASVRWLRPEGSTDQVTLRGRRFVWSPPGPLLGLLGMGLALAGLALLLLA